MCYVVNNFFDRNVNICLRVEDIGIILVEKIIWWYVDFGSSYNVYNIRIQFKEYREYCKYLINIFVEKDKMELMFN